jgi:CBS domain-containing protein
VRATDGQALIRERWNKPELRAVYPGSGNWRCTMLVQSILKRKGSTVFLIGCNATIEQAAQFMVERNVGALVVTMGERVVGVISHRDIVAGLARLGSRLSTVSVSALMRREFVSVSPQEDIKRVMALMTMHRTTHVPVLVSGRLAGIVSIGDLVKHRLEELELETNVLRDAYICLH